jgi:predicted dehydrogenase
MMCDISQVRLKHLSLLYPEVEPEEDFDRLLSKSSNLDAIAVATSVQHHFKMAKACLLAGKHTLIEKPMASTSAECEELISIAHQRGLVLMVDHTFLYSAVVRKIKEIVKNHDIGDIRYISARRLNLGLFQTDQNVAWDLAPHDISIILDIMQEMPQSVRCRGSAHITSGVEDETSISLQFKNQKVAIIQSSWIDPRKIREMTIVGSERMLVYDDVASQEKIKIYDSRVKRPPHYDTFAQFHYAYHYGDVYCPHVAQDEPLKTECQHFLDCIRNSSVPLTPGSSGLDVVKVLEAGTESLRLNGVPIDPCGNHGQARFRPKPSGRAEAAPVPRPAAQGTNGAAKNGNGMAVNGSNGQKRTAAK